MRPAGSRSADFAPTWRSKIASVPAELAPYYVAPDDEPAIPPAEMTELLRRKIKYVFVIFNENHSFDNEWGMFAVVNGIYSDGYTAEGCGVMPLSPLASAAGASSACTRPAAAVQAVHDLSPPRMTRPRRSKPDSALGQMQAATW